MTPDAKPEPLKKPPGPDRKRRSDRELPKKKVS